MKSTDALVSDDPYLPSGHAASPNLLESLYIGPKRPGLEPRIPALSLLLASPQYHELASDDLILKMNSHAIFRAIPALSARIRYLPGSSHAGKPTLIASLEVETATYLDTDLIITAIRLETSGGLANDLKRDNILKLPLRCRPKDNPVFLFHLYANESDFDAGSTTRTLDITIEANVMVSGKCSPLIQMHWTTIVDFSSVLKLNYGALGHTLQRNRWSSSLLSTLHHENVPQAMNVISGSVKKEVASTPDPDITINFGAPRQIWVGEPFPLDISIVNRSTKSRNLAISTIPNRRRVESKSHGSKSSSSSLSGRKETEITEVVTDENLLYARQRSMGRGSSQLVPLSTDVVIR